MSTQIIHLADYDPRWPQMFEEERALIQEALGDRCVAIEHVGSTSIPGIAAKPVIDIAVATDISSAYKTIWPLSKLGYRCMGEAMITDRIYFKKPWDSHNFAAEGPRRTHQVHMYDTRHEEWARHLAFRDYLRTHDDLRDEYEALKRRLAVEHAGDMEAYADAKSPFVERVIRLAGGPERTWVWEE